MSKVEDEVCEKLQERAKVGLGKYGVTMERDDLSHDEWLEHLQHELMDAIVYVQRLRTREQTLEAKLREAVDFWEEIYEIEEHSDMSFVIQKLEALLDEASE